MAIAGAFAVGAAPARAAMCPTSDGTPTGTPELTASQPCWEATTPYPFGYDGNPVDDNSQSCIDLQNSGRPTTGTCWLTVASVAFRSWNRGLAAMEPNLLGGSNSAFSVWLYNGVRWFPDPTFPGPATCPGATVLWAGKLDYWLIGGTTLCRFDGVNFAWDPLSVPAATKAYGGGNITSGACFSWNDCWFFGNNGGRVHWDGQTLTDASVGPRPWLQGYPTDATVSTDVNGSPFALATSNPEVSTLESGPSASAQPDGSPAPQLFLSHGGGFSPVAFSPPSTDPASSYSLDLAAAGFNTSGDGWLAADFPRMQADPSYGGGFQSGNVPQPGNQPAPLIPVDSSGQPRACPGAPTDGLTPSSSFWYTGGTSPSYYWSSIAVMPDGDAVAGGEVAAQAPGSGAQYQQVIVQVGCDHAPVVTDPPAPVANTIDTDITAVAANAANDGWAASNGGQTNGGQRGYLAQPPQLYHLTDGQPPQAPAGDDSELRPQVIQDEPTIFQFAPPVVVPPPPPPVTTVTGSGKRPKPVKLKPAIFDLSKPKLAKAGTDTFILKVRFKVRRTIRLELEALHHKKVVAKSGFHTFRGKTGTLSVRVTRETWPTGLKFVEPPGKKA